MLRYIVKRILALIPVLFCVAFLIFTMMYFSRGDPATMTLGDQATEEQLAEWRAAVRQLHLGNCVPGRPGRLL